MALTAERLRELVHYDPETGVFTRLRRLVIGRRSGGGKAGDLLGSIDDQGYARIMVERVRYQAQRLAVLYVTGNWPTGEVDHINGKRADNRWSNLRDVTRAQNQQNRRGASANSSSGLLGVSFERQRGNWKAHISVDGRKKNLGRYATAEEAYAVYLRAKRELHSGCTI